MRAVLVLMLCLLGVFRPGESVAFGVTQPIATRVCVYGSFSGRHVGK